MSTPVDGSLPFIHRIEMRISHADGVDEWVVTGEGIKALAETDGAKATLTFSGIETLHLKEYGERSDDVGPPHGPGR